MFQPWYLQDQRGVLSFISIFLVHDLHLSFVWRRFLHLKITQSQRTHSVSGVLRSLEVLHVGRKDQVIPISLASHTDVTFSFQVRTLMSWKYF